MFKIASRSKVPRVLTIAGSDSGGGAGIQADLKTFQALGCFGMSAITACTAQNTQTVAAIYPLSSTFITRQIECVMEDIGADAIKVGMLFSCEIIKTVAANLKRYPNQFIVLDPVMVSKSKQILLQENAIEMLIAQLLPTVDIVTPNIPEAEILAKIKITTREGMMKGAAKILKHCPAVVIKGGHMEGSAECHDLFQTRDSPPMWFTRNRLPNQHTHGTGCTLSAAIAAYRARKYDLKTAVNLARDYVQGAIFTGLPLGKGCGPVDHNWMRLETKND